MRRDDNKSDHEFDQIARDAKWGHLGILTADGYPRVVTVDFVAVGRTIYFHGALDGEKFDILATNPKVTFEINIPYASIPSTWRSKDYACPATTLYKSILIKGVGSVVDDLQEKVTGLQALMDKHQPNAEYARITAEAPMYRKPLQKVAVFKVTPDQVDVKSHFGQDYTDRVRRDLIARLEERNQGRDRQAAEILRSMLDEQKGTT